MAEEKTPNPIDFSEVHPDPAMQAERAESALSTPETDPAGNFQFSISNFQPTPRHPELDSGSAPTNYQLPSPISLPKKLLAAIFAAAFLGLSAIAATEAGGGGVTR